MLSGSILWLDSGLGAFDGSFISAWLSFNNSILLREFFHRSVNPLWAVAFSLAGTVTSEATDWDCQLCGKSPR